MGEDGWTKEPHSRLVQPPPCFQLGTLRHGEYGKQL